MSVILFHFAVAVTLFSAIFCGLSLVVSPRLEPKNGKALLFVIPFALFVIATVGDPFLLNEAAKTGIMPVLRWLSISAIFLFCLNIMKKFSKLKEDFEEDAPKTRTAIILKYKKNV